jgi:hypothetical protein
MNDHMPWSSLSLLEKAVVIVLVGIPLLGILHALFC